MNSPTIHWFRLDLRLADNPSLRAAAEQGGPVVPVFIWAPEEEGDWPPGAASKWWLHQSLLDLDGKLRRAGSRLVIRRGPTLEALRGLAKETGAKAVFWNRRYEPTMIARDAKVMQRLRTEGLAIETFNAALLHEPSTIHNQSGKPFRVFTPFWKHCLNRPDPAGPLPAPPNLLPPVNWPKSLALDQLELEPKLNWAEGMHAAWQPGADGATENLKTFLAQAFDRYSDLRNRPNLVGTSRLSPHLHFGEISPRQVWHTLARWASKHGLPVEAWRNSQFLAELGWREFAHHLLYHFPQTPTEPLRAEFSEFPWRKEATWLQAWQRGQTGFPLWMPECASCGRLAGCTIACE